ncbi:MULTISPECIES: hypothetical protein [Streptomyces]|uniref:Outer membrane channel protein CpnT-like N-terminal domain-containing protein n=1 Tax=Streptomyces ramulosus TaxID=47762 RepID=A0ABW1FKK4_9ACTN
MSLQISDEGRGWFIALTGQDFTHADEDKLRELGDGYGQIRQKLDELPEQVVHAVNTVRNSITGDTADAYAKSLSEFTTGERNYIRAGQELSGGLEKMAKSSSVNIEYMKIMAILQITEMLIEIVIAIAMLQFEEIPEIKFKASTFLQRLLRSLLDHLAMHVVLNESIGTVLDALAQRIQMAKGHRDAWDVNLTKDAALGGLLDGLLEGPLSLLGGKVGQKLSDLFAGPVAKNVGKQITNDLSIATDTVADTTSKSLADGVENIITKNADDLLRPLGGSAAGKGVGESATKKISDDFGDLFAHTFKDTLGEQAARDLGKQYGNAFAKNWGNESRPALKEVLDNGGGQHLNPAVHQSLTNLSDTTLKAIRDHHDNVAVKTSHFAGATGAVTGQAYLSEGFFNLLFSDEKSFSVTPVSGASAAAGQAATHAGTVGGASGLAALTNAVKNTPGPLPTTGVDHSPATGPDTYVPPALSSDGQQNAPTDTTPPPNDGQQQPTASDQNSGGGPNATATPSSSQQDTSQQNIANHSSSGGNGGDDGNNRPPAPSHYEDAISDTDNDSVNDDESVNDDALNGTENATDQQPAATSHTTQDTRTTPTDDDLRESGNDRSPSGHESELQNTAAAQAHVLSGSQHSTTGQQHTSPTQTAQTAQTAPKSEGMKDGTGKDGTTPPVSDHRSGTQETVHTEDGPKQTDTDTSGEDTSGKATGEPQKIATSSHTDDTGSANDSATATENQSDGTPKQPATTPTSSDSSEQLTDEHRTPQQEQQTQKPQTQEPQQTPQQEHLPKQEEQQPPQQEPGQQQEEKKEEKKEPEQKQHPEPEQHGQHEQESGQQEQHGQRKPVPEPQKQAPPEPSGSKWGDLTTLTEQNQGPAPMTPPEFVTRERHAIAEHTVDGDPYQVLNIPGNGDCLFASVLVGAYHQNVLPEIRGLDVQGLRKRLATDLEENPQKLAEYDAVLDPVDLVLQDVFDHRTHPHGDRKPADVHKLQQEIKKGLAHRSAAVQERAWQKLLAHSNYQGLRHVAPSPRKARDLGIAGLVREAAKGRENLWNSPFAEYLPQLLTTLPEMQGANLTLISTVPSPIPGAPPVLQSPQPLAWNPDAPPLYVFYEDRSVHYQAMAKTMSETPHDTGGPLPTSSQDKSGSSKENAPQNPPEQQEKQEQQQHEEQKQPEKRQQPEQQDQDPRHSDPLPHDGQDNDRHDPNDGRQDPSPTPPQVVEVPQGFGKDGRYGLGQFGRVHRFGDIAFGSGGRRPDGLHTLVRSALDHPQGPNAAKKQPKPANLDRLADKLSAQLWQDLSGPEGQILARKLFDEGGLKLRVPVGRFQNTYSVTLKLSEVHRDAAQHLNAPPPHSGPAPGATPAPGAARNSEATGQLLFGESDKGQREAAVNYNVSDSSTVSNSRSVSATTSHATTVNDVGVKPKVTLTGSSGASKGHSNLTNTYVRPEINLAGTREHFGFEGATLTVDIRRGGDGRRWTDSAKDTLEVTFPTELTDPKANHTEHPWEVHSGSSDAARKKLARALQGMFFIAQESHGQSSLASALKQQYASVGPESGPARMLDSWFSEHGMLWSVHRLLSSTLLPSTVHKGTHYAAEARAGVTSVRRVGDATKVGLAGNTRDWNSVFHTDSKSGGKTADLTVVIGPEALPMSFPIGVSFGTSNSASLTEGYTGGTSNTTRFNGSSVPYELKLNVEAGLNPVGSADFSQTREVTVIIRVPEHLTGHFEQQLADVARKDGGQVVQGRDDTTHTTPAPGNDAAHQSDDDTRSVHERPEEDPDEITEVPREDASDQRHGSGEQHTPPKQPPTRGLFSVFGLQGLEDLPSTFLRDAQHLESRTDFRHKSAARGKEHRHALGEFLTTHFHADQLSHMAPDVMNGGVRRTFRSPKGESGQLLMHFGVTARPARPGEQPDAWRLPVASGTVQKWPTNWSWLQDSQGHTTSQSFTVGGTLSGDVTDQFAMTPADAFYSRGRDHSQSDGITTYGFSHMGANASGEMWHDSYPVVFETTVEVEHVSGTKVLNDQLPPVKKTVNGRADYLVPKSLPVEEHSPTEETHTEETHTEQTPETQPKHQVTVTDVEPTAVGRKKSYPPLTTPEGMTENRIGTQDRIDHVHGALDLQREAAKLFEQAGIPKQDAVPYVEKLLTPDQLKGILNRDAQSSAGRLVREKTFTDNNVQFVVEAITVNDKSFAQTQELSNFTLDEAMSRFTSTDKTVITNSRGLGGSLSGSRENGDESGGGSGDGSLGKATSSGTSTVKVTSIHPGQFVDQTLPHRQHEADVIWRLSVVQRDTNMLGTWGTPQVLVKDVQVEGGVSYLRPEYTKVTAAEAKVPERLTKLPLTAMTTDLSPRSDASTTGQDGNGAPGRSTPTVSSSILTTVETLLQKYAPDALGKNHDYRKPGTMTKAGGDSIFDARSLQSTSSVLRGTGLHFRMRTDGFGHHTYTNVVAQLTRGSDGAHFTGKVSKGVLSRYTQSHIRTEEAHSQTVKHSGSFGGGGSGGKGSDGASPSLSVGFGRSTTLSDSDAIMIRRHDAYTTAEEDLYVYEVDSSIELTVESVSHASQLVSAITGGKADAIKGGAEAVWKYIRNNDDGTRTLSIPVREEVVVARSELSPEQLRQVEQHNEQQDGQTGNQDAHTAAPQPTPTPKPTPIGKDEFRNHGVLVDMNESSSRKLFDDLMKELSKHDGAPKKFAEQGQAGREQLRQLLNSRELAWQLHGSGLGVTSDFGARLTTEAGVTTLTYGKLRLTFTQLDFGSPEGWTKGTSERSDYRYQYNTQSHAVGKDRSIGGGSTANFLAATGNKMTQGLTGKFKQGRTETHDSGGFTSMPTESIDRTVHWLRHSPAKLRVDIQLTADSSADKVGLGAVTGDDGYHGSFVLDDMLQLRYSPEAVVREVGGVTEAAVQVDSGWYLAPHHAGDDRQTAGMLDALRTAQDTDPTDNRTTWHVTSGGDGTVLVRDERLSEADFLDRYVRPQLTAEQNADLHQLMHWEGEDTPGSLRRLHIDNPTRPTSDDSHRNPDEERNGHRGEDRNESRNENLDEERDNTPDESRDESRNENRNDDPNENPDDDRNHHQDGNPDNTPDPTPASPLPPVHGPQVPRGFGDGGQHPLGQFGSLVRIGDIPIGVPGPRPASLTSLVRAAVDQTGTTLTPGHKNALVNKLAADMWQKISSPDGKLLVRKLLSKDGLLLDLYDDRQSKYRMKVWLDGLSRNEAIHLVHEQVSRPLPYGAKVVGHREAILNRQYGGTHTTSNSRSVTSTTSFQPTAEHAALSFAVNLSGSSSASAGQSFLHNSYDRPEFVFDGKQEHFAFPHATVKTILYGVPKSPGDQPPFHRPVPVEVAFPHELTSHEANHTSHDWEIAPHTPEDRSRVARALQDMFFLVRESSGQEQLVTRLTAPYPHMGEGSRAHAFLNHWFGEMGTIANFSRMLSATRLPSVHSNGHHYVSDVRAEILSLKRSGDAIEAGLANNVRMWDSLFHTTSQGGGKSFGVDLTVGPKLSEDAPSLSVPFSFALSSNNSASLTEGNTGGTSETVRFNGKSVPYEVHLMMEATLTEVGAPAMPPQAVPVRLVVHVPEHLADHFEYQLAKAAGRPVLPPLMRTVPPPNPPAFGLYEGFGVSGLSHLVDHFRRQAVVAERDVGFSHPTPEHRTRHLDQLNRFLEIQFHANELSRKTGEMFGDGIHLTFLGPRGNSGTQLLLHFTVKGERHTGDGTDAPWRLPVEDATVQKWPTHWNWLATTESVGNGQSLSFGFSMSLGGGGVTFTPPPGLSFGRSRDVSLTNGITTYAFSHQGTNASGTMWHDHYPARYEVSVYAEKVTGAESETSAPHVTTPTGGVQYLVPKSLTDLPLIAHADGSGDGPPPVPQRAQRPVWNGKTMTFSDIALPEGFTQERLRPDDRLDHVRHAQALRRAAAELLSELRIPPYVVSYLQHMITTDQLKGALSSDAKTLPGRFVIGGQFADTQVYLMAQAVTGNKKPLSTGTQELSSFGLTEYMLRHTRKTQISGTNSFTSNGGMAYEGTRGDNAGSGSFGYAETWSRAKGRTVIDIDDTHPGEFYSIDVPHEYHSLDVVWRLNIAVTRDNMLGTWKADGLSTDLYVPGGATIQRPVLTRQSAQEAGVPPTLEKLPILSMTTGLTPVPVHDPAGGPREQNRAPGGNHEESQESREDRDEREELERQGNLDGTRGPDERQTVLHPTLSQRVLTELVTLLSEAAPQVLGPLHTLNTPAGTMKSMADSILDGTSLRNLSSLLRDTGLTLQIRLDGFGHHDRVDVHLRMDRDTAEAARFTGKSAHGVLSRYIQSNTRQEEQFSTSRKHSKGITLGAGGSGPGGGGSVSASFTRTTGDGVANNASVMVRRHDAYTTGAEDLFVYEADAHLTLSVESFTHASQLVDALLLGRAHLIGAGVDKVATLFAPGRKEPHRIVLPVHEEVFVPRSELPVPVEGAPTPMSPITSHEFLGHDVLVDMDEKAGHTLFTDLMEQLATHPGTPKVFADPRHGGHVQLKQLIGARELARHMARTGLGTPTTQTATFPVRITAEGGVATHTHAQLTVEFRPRDLGLSQGWHQGTGERADYDLQNDIDAHTDNVGSKLGGGVSGSFHGVKQAFAASSSVTHTLENDSGGQVAVQKSSIDRTVHWQRHTPTSVDVVVKIATYGTFDAFGKPKISGKNVFEGTFTLNDALQLRFSPEAVLRGVGGVRPGAIRVESGWYVPPHPYGEANEAQQQAMRDALLTAQDTDPDDQRQTVHLTADGDDVLVGGERMGRQQFLDRYVKPHLTPEQAAKLDALARWEGGAGAALLLHLDLPGDALAAHGPRPKTPEPDAPGLLELPKEPAGLKRWADAVNTALDEAMEHY